MIGQIKMLLKHTEEYVETNVELTRLQVVNSTTETISYMVTMMAVIISVLLFVFMLCIGLSIFIGHAIGKVEYGFFIMAAIMGLSCIILYTKRESLLKNRVCDLLIKKILN